MCFIDSYETKPALSVPIHVVELSNVPQELRMSAAVPPPQPSAKQSATDGQPKKVIESSDTTHIIIDNFLLLEV